MIALQIKNPEIEKLVKEIFPENRVDNSPELLLFLQKQKIIKDLHESFQQADSGQVLGIDETFDNVFTSLGI